MFTLIQSYTKDVNPLHGKGNSDGQIVQHSAVTTGYATSDCNRRVEGEKWAASTNINIV